MSQPQLKSQMPERHLFGTDGVRGVANQEPMTSEMALKLVGGTTKDLTVSQTMVSWLRFSPSCSQLSVRNRPTTSNISPFILWVSDSASRPNAIHGIKAASF